MQDLTSITHETLLLEVRKQIPHPVKTESQLDGTIVLTGGKPGEVIVRINEDEISIAVFAIRWDGPHTRVVNPRELAKFNWRLLPASQTIEAVQGFISSAVQLRRAEYRQCEQCGETTPPEWMHDKRVCHSCAEHHLGVIY
jgi:NADH pyrophosphatase NudC (nudix superfamily)